MPSLISTAMWTALHAGYSPFGIAEVFLIGLFFSLAAVEDRQPVGRHLLPRALQLADRLVLRYVPLPA